MKKLSVIAVFLLLAGCCMAQSLNPYFYYFEGKKHHLEFNPDYAFVEMTGQDVAKSNAMLRASTLLQDENAVPAGEPVWMEVDLTKLRAADYSAKVAQLKEADGVTSVTPYFKAQNGNKVALSDYFYVKLKSETDAAALRKYSAEKQVEIVKQDEFMPLWYQLSARNSGMNAMECANMYYESGLFECAEPDLVSIRKAQSRVVSGEQPMYYYYQWGMKNIGQYNGVTGFDVNMPTSMPPFYVTPAIAIVDQGVQRTHPSLSPVVNSYSYDAQSATSPSKVYGSHGTACAGIALAKPITNVDLKGVCQHGTLMDISHPFGTAESTAGFARGINAAIEAGADVISNSWGDDTPSQLLKDAIVNATTYGRYGLGCVVVFASGNENAGYVNFPGEMSEVITVGAMAPDGTRKSPSSIDGEDWWGSNNGSGLDIMAPGVLIATTDLVGTEGYNPYASKHPNNFTNYSYDKFFNGTSAAVPFVSGAAALMIAANPLMTLDQLKRHLFTNTTKLRGNMMNTIKEYGSWNSDVGYGLLNVQKALMAANNDALYISGNKAPIGQTAVFELKFRNNSNIVFPDPMSSRISVFWSVSSSAYKLEQFMIPSNNAIVKQVSQTNNIVTLTAKIYGSVDNGGQKLLQTVTTYLMPQAVTTASYSVAQNPVSDVLRLQKAESDAESVNVAAIRSASDITVSIYSNLTREITRTFSSSEKELTVDVSGLLPGNYILKVTKGSEAILTQTIIVRH